jgi:rRNA maturation endonuclease Nob1
MPAQTRRSISIWCLQCARITKYSTAPDPQDHNVCLDCGSHAASCNGCIIAQR